MTTTKLLLLCMCCLIVAPALWAQAPSGAAKPGILGYFDPASGAFRPVAAAEESADPATATTFTGTITVTLTITLKTTTLTTVSCSGAVSVLDGTTSPTFYTESNTVPATGTGTTKTCKISIPYSWSLTNQTADNMTTAYTVFGAAGITATTQRTAGRSPLDVRKVPINGTTTALTASVTL